MPKLLLLSCCAPCSCAVIDNLAKENVDFAVLFYNSNISPAAEYEKRRQENEPERGKRCSVCFYLRLKRAMQYAKENGFDLVTSVLGISRYKDMDQVNAAARQASRETNMPYDFTNWRKGGLEPLRQHLVKETQMYAQDYCGCPFSKRAKD